jgi:hypothetical protein
MLLHVLHRAVELRPKPLAEPGFGRREVDVADPELLETEFAAPALDVRLQE